MSDDPIPGRALATRRAVTDVVRAAVLGSYGVAGLSAGPVERVRAALAGRPPGLRIRLRERAIEVRVAIRVAAGLPVAEVARQVDAAVRYGLERSFGRTADPISIRIRGLAEAPGSLPPAPHLRSSDGPSDLADSGTDVA